MKPTETEIRAIAGRKYVKHHSGFINEQIDLDRSRNARIESFVDGFNEAISQMQPEWVAVDDRFPEIGKPVIVQTEYLDKGKPVSEVFSGYMDESGELYVYPNDDHYGWTFEECVTQWCVLPQPPTK